jgi:hypothetical protein
MIYNSANDYILCFFIIFFLILLLLYLFNSYESFTDIIDYNDNLEIPEEIDFSQLNELQILESNPIIKCENHIIDNNNDIVTLDKYSSKYNINTFKNEFSYCRIFIDFILKPNVNKQNILVMGFGLGGIPLELSLDNNIKNIDTVDVDLCMFKMYKTLIKNPPNKIKYFLLDANKFLEKTSNKYDIIIDDVFDYLDKKFYNFNLAYEKLNNDGWLLINMHDYNDYLKYEKELKKIFKKVYVDNTMNICVFCQK